MSRASQVRVSGGPECCPFQFLLHLHSSDGSEISGKTALQATTTARGFQLSTHGDALQVMPQLLNFLGVPADDKHALDWGTIAVYSCAASCKTPDAYVDEHVVVQP